MKHLHVLVLTGALVLAGCERKTEDHPPTQYVDEQGVVVYCQPTMVVIDPRARVRGMQTPAVMATIAALAVWQTLKEPELRITSITDGQHRPSSLHYTGDAIDLRPPKKASRKKAVQLLRLALGPDFDVLDEGDHIHVEYDPKRKRKA